MLNVETVKDLRELIKHMSDDTLVVVNLRYGALVSEVPVVFQDTKDARTNENTLHVVGYPWRLEHYQHKDIVWSDPTTHTRLALVIE